MQPAVFSKLGQHCIRRGLHGCITVFMLQSAKVIL